jgi:uncharacterized protein with HEPN domain
MSRSIAERLGDVHDEVMFVIRVTAGVSKESFLSDETLKRAIARSLEIVGEAAKHVPADFATRILKSRGAPSRACAIS